MEGKFNIVPLAWDTDFFKMKCAKASVYGVLTPEDVLELVKKCGEYEFVTIENVCGDYRNDYLLGEKTEAYMVDCPISLHKEPVFRRAEEFPDVKVRVATRDDMDELLNIARKAFVHSRFSNDPNISSEQVGGLYSSWLKNAFDDENKIIFTTEDRSGFLIYFKDDEEPAINLLATDTEKRKKGTGTALIYFAENYAKEQGCSSFYVGTQVSNIPAVNLYLKCGFKIFKTSRTYHLRNHE